VRASRDRILEKARLLEKETKQIEFKETFDADSPRHWCEIIKDVVAISNSGGGCILIGVRNDGTPSQFEHVSALNLEPAQVTDKIANYTGQQFAQFEVTSVERHGENVPALLIDGVPIPMVFIKPGTYDLGNGRQQRAFQAGAVYFRHGAKSEPGNNDDLRDAIEREIRRIRKSWLGNIRKVIRAPLGYEVWTLPPDVRIDTALTAAPIRITDEPNAPALRLETPDASHPFRQKEVVQIVNERLKGARTVNSYDMLCVRKVHAVNETKPQYYYRSKYGCAQYSMDFVNWLVASYEHDPSFFDKARAKCSSISK